MPTNDKLKRVALSMWQPWASLLAHGIKRCESRGQDTKFRGEFFIHATQSITKKVYDEHYLGDTELRLIVNDFLQIQPHYILTLKDLRSMFPLGGIIGKAHLFTSGPSWDIKDKYTDLYSLAPLQSVLEWDREFIVGDHGSDRFAWACKDHTAFKDVSPIKGQQLYFWPVPDAFALNP